MTNTLTCPECGDPLGVDEEWRITDRSKLGTTVEGGESIQDDYAHARCLDGGEPIEAGQGGSDA